MSVSNYQSLRVWQAAMDLTMETYKQTRKLPREELFSLTGQMRRAAVSIPSNIAEGNGRQTAKEFQQFLRIAKGSAAELETQFLICQRIGYLTQDDVSLALCHLTEISKMITKLQPKPL
ncbi:MAG: four helix bundle protein [Clostridiales bacterium]|nr:four helix bundle protein [Clostridiales bacterium]